MNISYFMKCENKNYAIRVIIPIMCPTKSVAGYKYTLTANIYINKVGPQSEGLPRRCPGLGRVGLGHWSITYEFYINLYRYLIL